MMSDQIVKTRILKQCVEFLKKLVPPPFGLRSSDFLPFWDQMMLGSKVSSLILSVESSFQILQFQHQTSAYCKSHQHLEVKAIHQQKEKKYVTRDQ